MEAKIFVRIVIAMTAIFAADISHAAWSSTGFTDVNILMDNGVTYFYPINPSTGAMDFPLGGNCLYSRLELRETGDRYGNVENGRRMMALILSAKLAGKRISLGFDNEDGPACRIAQLNVEW